jgi:hypothetical protein
MDGYGNFMMHQQQQQQVSPNFYNDQPQQRSQNGSSYGYQDWAGVPLIKSAAESRHKKLFTSRSNGYDEGSMSRLAKHTHGAPIIMSSRYRSKSVKPMQPLGHENGNLRNYNGFSKAPVSDETHNYDDSGFHANGTCLPRIIKPRKRRKKDRKPIVGASMENNPPNPFTFASNQSNVFMQSAANGNNNNNVYQSPSTESFKRPAPPNESNLFFNCDFDPSSVLPLPSSTSSSPISLSNSSLSSSTTSSCSCRLCDPNCKIWAFPLRRSFSDNSAVELDHHNNTNSGNNSDGTNIETSKKDVGVIGGNRVKNEWNSGGEATFSILDLIELNHYQNQQQKSALMDVNRLRSESLSDSGDSGCDLLLCGLNISDDILSSTFKTNEGINMITQQISDFSLMTKCASDTRTGEDAIFNDNDMKHLNANECLDRRSQHDSLRTCQFSSNNNIQKSMSCEFGDHQQGSNLDKSNLLTMDMASSSSNCNYGNLLSPMLVNKQNFSNFIDVNNNNHLGSTQTVVDGYEESLKERTLLFDCFDVTWKGS